MSHPILDSQLLTNRRQFFGRAATLGGSLNNAAVKKLVARMDRLPSVPALYAEMVTVIDGHPATLSWLGSVHGHRVMPLGVTRFGQSGDLPDLYPHVEKGQGQRDLCLRQTNVRKRSGKTKTM